jgi:hypothetical protein
LLTKVVANDEQRPCQGAIYSDVLYVDRVERETDEGEERVLVQQILFPWVVVLTQECDLQWDYEARWGDKRPGTFGQVLLSVLAAPMYHADHLHGGTHLSALKVHAREDAPFVCHHIPTDHWDKYVRKNRDPRYHYMDLPESLRLPPVVIDFKHYFGISAEVLAQSRDKCLGRLGNLDRLHVSQRFASFLTRVGIPEAAPQED